MEENVPETVTGPGPKPKARFARRSGGNYDLIVAAFCGVLIISNVSAVKLIDVGPVIVDGGVFLFPIVYILGDVLSEVFGFKATRRAILIGFALSAVAAATFVAVQYAPAASSWGNQDAFEAVLGFVPRIVIASVLGYLVGQLLNSYVLVKIKERTSEKALWARLIGSTLVGELADTVVFCVVAFYGIITGGEFLNYVITGYLYKCALEIVLLPATYAVIRAVKEREPSYLVSHGGR